MDKPKHDVIMKRYYRIKQHDTSDCGAASLASVAAWYGLKLPIAKLRTLSATSQTGTSVQGIIDAASQIGITVKALRAPAKEDRADLTPLYLIPKPAILHLLKEQRLLHFVVLYRSGKKQFTIMDPAYGQLIKVTPEQLSKEWTGIVLLAAPDATFMKGDHRTPFKTRIWQLIRYQKSDLFKALVGALSYTLIGIGISLFVQQVIDHILPNNNLNLLHLLGTIMGVLILAAAFIGFFRSLLLLRTGLKTDARLILSYYQRLLALPQSFFDQRQTGEIISRLNDAFKVRSFITDNIIQIAVCFFSLFFACCLMFTYYWKLALLVVITIPLYSLIYILFNKVNKTTQRRGMVEAAQMEATLVENLRGIRTIKSLCAESVALSQTEQNFTQLAHTIYRGGKNALWANGAGDFISKVSSLLLLWSGTYFVLSAQLSAGALLSFYTLIAYFSGPVTQLIGMNAAYQNARIAADRLFEITDLEEESSATGYPVKPAELGDICFDHISFHYPGRRPLFLDFSLTIPKGRVTAVAGESGSGKSSLAGLLLQLYTPQSGIIRVGNLNIAHIACAHWRNYVSVVPQKIDLFTGTLFENITIGASEKNPQKAFALCQELGLSSFIETLPHGLFTPIGEQGIRLSGGQQQKIAIARALYRDPKILILDEATSSLDSDSEHHIQNAIYRLREQECTVLLIAHRISSLRIADNITVLKEGVIAEEGTHEQLLQKEGYYASWCQTQMNMIQ